MVRAAECRSMHQDWAQGEEEEHCPTKLEAHASRPQQQKQAAQNREQWRNKGASHLDRARSEWSQGVTEPQDGIIQWRGRVRRRAFRIVFERVMPQHQTRM